MIFPIEVNLLNSDNNAKQLQPGSLGNSKDIEVFMWHFHQGMHCFQS